MSIDVWVFLKQFFVRLHERILKKLALWLRFTNNVFIVWTRPDSRFNRSIKFHHKLNLLNLSIYLYLYLYLYLYISVYLYLYLYIYIYIYLSLSISLSISISVSISISIYLSLSLSLYIYIYIPVIKALREHIGLYF